MGVWPEPCTDCGGDGQFDEGPPDAGRAEMRPCKVCQGTGRAYCEECRKEEAYMRAWVHYDDEGIKAWEQYLCLDCADKAMTEGRLLLVLSSASGPGGEWDRHAHSEAEVGGLSLRLKSGELAAFVQGFRAVGTEAPAVVLFSSNILDKGISLTPMQALELGSRLVAAARFGAQPRRQDAGSIISQAFARLL